MGKEILQKYTVFEVKRQLAEMEKQYGKERVAEMLGEGRAAEIDREFKKAVAERLEPYWKDIQAYEHGGFWARLRVEMKYTFRENGLNATFRKAYYRRSLMICSPISARSSNPKKASANLRSGKRKRSQHV